MLTVHNRAPLTYLKQLEQELNNLREREKDLREEQKRTRRKMLFPCCCGTPHELRAFVLIQTHWYTDGDGHGGGDRWNSGEWQLLCPDKPLRNRLLFSDPYFVPRERQYNSLYSTKAAFEQLYAGCFKKVVEVYDDEDKKFPGTVWKNVNMSNYPIFGLPTLEEVKDRLRKDAVP